MSARASQLSLMPLHRALPLSRICYLPGHGSAQGWAGLELGKNLLLSTLSVLCGNISAYPPGYTWAKVIYTPFYNTTTGEVNQLFKFSEPHKWHSWG